LGLARKSQLLQAPTGELATAGVEPDAGFSSAPGVGKPLWKSDNAAARPTDSPPFLFFLAADLPDLVA
jgi:hypothetical protein